MKHRSIALAHLNHYNTLLTNNIQRYGFCPEYLNLTQEAKITETRLLCQSRGIFFLLEQAKITHDTTNIVQAFNLYDMINEVYYDKNNATWHRQPQTTHHELDIMLYEYAFILTALAKLYAHSQDQVILERIFSTAEIIHLQFYSPNSNFAKLNKSPTGIGQNALMHLFEAYLEAYISTQQKYFLDKLNQLGHEIITLFYNPKVGLIKEYSTANIFEPGHSFEWAALIYEASLHKANLPNIVEHQQLAAQAEKFGVINDYLVLAEINENTVKNAASFRIWPSLERLRYYAMTDNQSAVDKTVVALCAKFFAPDGLPFEYINQNYQASEFKVKSTTGYHLINCFKYLI